ncbi:MAG: hypothetical protein ACMUJM_09850 [bacterium]
MWGWVRDIDTNEGIVGAKICTALGQCVSSFNGWHTNDYTSSITSMEKEFFFIDALPKIANGLEIIVEAENYYQMSDILHDYNENLVNKTFYLKRKDNKAYHLSVDQRELEKTIHQFLEKILEIKIWRTMIILLIIMKHVLSPLIQTIIFH